MQEQSLTTSHQQTHAQPLRAAPTLETKCLPLTPFFLCLSFIAEHDVMWYGKDLWPVQASCLSLLLIPSLFPSQVEQGKKESLAIEQAVFSSTPNTVVPLL